MVETEEKSTEKTGQILWSMKHVLLGLLLLCRGPAGRLWA